jgi:hemerythrin-like domain-containing protein
MNIYDILHDEHVEVLNMLEKLSSARSSDQKKQLVNEIVDELTAHSQAEEVVLYDRLAESEEDKDLTLEAKEEHLIVTRLLEDLLAMRIEDERFGAKVKVLTDMVQHHVDEEEGETFAAARRVFDDDIAENFGGEYLAMRDTLKRQPKLLRLGTARVKRAVETVAHVISPSPEK